jgi:hypothetical protein
VHAMEFMFSGSRRGRKAFSAWAWIESGLHQAHQNFLPADDAD